MKTLQSYMVQEPIRGTFELGKNRQGRTLLMKSGQFFYLVWIKNELESKRAESPFSKN